MTEKLYYDDPEVLEFSARIIDTVKLDRRTGLILDRTYFYPEGGGQPADRGKINDVNVIDVQLVDGRLIHFTDRLLPAGPITASIDGAHRMDYRQQHTAQHILSQALLQVCSAATVSVHFGEDYTSIEIDNQHLSVEEMADVELLANRIVSENRLVKTHWVPANEVSRYRLRRPPPAVDRVRIVEIEDFDVSACGGIHLRHTGQVGLIKLIGQEKIRKRVRVLAKIGQRAFADYEKKNQVIHSMQKKLTCGMDELDAKIDSLLEQKAIQRRLAKLQKTVLSFYRKEAANLVKESSGIKYLVQEMEDIDGKYLRPHVQELLKNENCLTAVITRNGDSAEWVIGHNLGPRPDLRDVVRPFLPIIDGRGGGAPNFLQGKAGRPSAFNKFIQAIKAKVEQEYNQ